MMSFHHWPRHVAVLSEDRGFALELAQIIADGFRSHDCLVDVLSRTESWKRHYDFVLGYGPHTREGSLLETALRLASYPKEKRPFFYWWFTEAVSKPGLPPCLVRFASGLQTAGNLYLTRHPRAHTRLWARLLDRFFLGRHFRLRIIGELHHFHYRGLLSGLAVTAEGKAAQLRRHGFEPVVAPVGYHPALHGRDLGLQRDIDVGFLGRIRTKRRLRLLQQVERDLEKRGIKVTIPSAEVDGEEQERQHCAVYTYCLMPDHLHYLVGPVQEGVSVLVFSDQFKGKTTNRSWQHGWRGKLWQPRSYDHIVRVEEDLRQIAEYILNNPVRKGLVDHAEDWPWSGHLTPLLL